MRAKKLAPIHSGDTWQELFLGPLGLSQHELAKALGINVSTANRIVRGKCSITEDTAMRLEGIFGPPCRSGSVCRLDLEVAKDQSEAEIRKTVKPGPNTHR